MTRIIRDASDVAEGLEALLAIDPRLRPIAAQSGPLPLRLAEPGFAGLAHIIVSQSVSRASAQAIWGRMCAADGPPSAEAYVALAPDAWRGFGLSRGKAETLLGVATAVAAKQVDLMDLGAKSPEEGLSRLQAFKGIGPWTAEVYLMFCCGHADLFPSGDVALQAAVGMGFEMETRPSARQVAALAAAWAPWRSVAARLFWSFYAVRTARDALPVG
jgi:DNA-3-methyladenine glycosylase II